MAIDGSEFTLRLGFKDSPGPGDDFVDLNYNSLSFSNPTKGRGYLIHQDGFSMGEAVVDENWGEVCQLNFSVRLDGDSRADVHAMLRNLNRFLLRSNKYFDDAGDNHSSRSDGKFHDGEATVLTFKPADADNEVYFDVISGTRAIPANLIEPQIRTISKVTFTLLVRAGSRSPLTKGGLARVRLNNGVAMGDAAEPLKVYSAYSGEQDALRCGWVFSGTTDWAIGDTTGGYLAPKYGVRVLTAQNSGTLTFTTNTFEVKQGDVVIPDTWLARGLSGSPSVTMKLQIWNGSVWADQQTFVSSPTLTLAPSFTAPVWTRFTGTAYTVASGITLGRITTTVTGLSGSLAGALGFDGIAAWKNPIGGVVPTTEYATGGKTAGIPAFNVYGIRGDVKTPIKMRIDNTSASQIERIFVMSGMTQDLGTSPNRIEYPLFGLDLAALQSVTTAANLPWGTLAGDQTGNGVDTSSTYQLITNQMVRYADRRQRIYRAIIFYAANDSAGITSVKLSMTFGSTANAETKTFNVALPQTYIGNTTPTAAQYLPYDLGEWQLSRPGIAWEENLQQVDATVILTHSNNANRHTSIAGVILLPTKPGALMAASLDIGSQAIYPLSVEIYNEGEAPRAGIQATPLSSGDIPIELSSYDPTSQLTGGDLWVMPAEATSPTMAMRFEILMFRTRDVNTPNLYGFDARDTKQVSIEYTPKYLNGMSS